VVAQSEALSLLARVPFGRIVFTEYAMPAVKPACHVVEAGVIVARSHDGSAVLAAGNERIPGPEPAAGGQRETVVAYQADDIDVGQHAGWSVVVTGPATLIHDPAEIERYADLLPPWTDARDGQLIRVYPGIVAGYRLTGEAR
jgi:pyridoxamine 5'-phosphate oxidase-like protein